MGHPATNSIQGILRLTRRLIYSNIALLFIMQLHQLTLVTCRQILFKIWKAEVRMLIEMHAQIILGMDRVRKLVTPLVTFQTKMGSVWMEISSSQLLTWEIHTFNTPFLSQMTQNTTTPLIILMISVSGLTFKTSKYILERVPTTIRRIACVMIKGQILVPFCK